MRTNEGMLDRGIRVIAGLALVALWLFGYVSGGWAIAAAAVGAVLVLTGAVGLCPLYALFGVSTAPKRTSGQA